MAKGSLGVERFTVTGTSEAKLDVHALAIHFGPASKSLWVVTPEETQKRSMDGAILARHPQSRETSQAWIAALD